eukprot:COSAG02_NODE_2145_length_9672_cov_1198.924266_8_plen_522_part_00
MVSRSAPQPTSRSHSPADLLIKCSTSHPETPGEHSHTHPRRPPWLWEPRAATIPGIILLLIAALLCEVAVMTYVSTPTDRERDFEDSHYTVEYRDCWVIERTAQSLPALGLTHMQPQVPVLFRELWGSGSSRKRKFNAAPGRAKQSYQHAPKLERLRTKLGPAMLEPELAALVSRLRVNLDASPHSTAAAAAALDDLIADLAVARGAEFASKTSLALDRSADPLHDMLWPQLCPEQDCAPAASCQSDVPWTPQGCWPFKDHWIGEVIHRVFHFINIGLCLVIMVTTLVWRGAFNAEYTFIHRLITSLVVLRLLRLLFFGCTSLPMINLSCRTQFGVNGIRNGGACGDFLFSGHGSIVAASVCLFWSQRAACAPRWPRLLLLPLTLILIVVTFGYAFERWHYTIDIMVGFCVTVNVWMASAPLFGDETVGVTKHRFLYLPTSLHRAFGRTKIGPIRSVVFVVIIGGVAAFMAFVTGDIFPELVRGQLEPDPIFGGLEGLAIAVVVVCWSITEETQPIGTPML